MGGTSPATLDAVRPSAVRPTAAAPSGGPAACWAFAARLTLLWQRNHALPTVSWARVDHPRGARHGCAGRRLKWD
eukprot:4234280-Lingulodinium_polyedra.AAC.1